MKVCTSLAALCLSLMLGIPALPSPCQAGVIIRINGSGSALDMMKPLIVAYQKNNKGLEILMEKPLGSSGAVKALLAGALDFVLSSKPLKAEEAAKGAKLLTYGKTPLVLIAEKHVRKNNITSKELEEIYTGKFSSWPGGEQVRLVMRPSEDIDTKILSDLSPGMAQAMTAARSRIGMIVAVTDPEASGTVAKTPGGFSATGLTSIISEKLPVASLTFNGIKASPRNLASGTYPIAKVINIVTNSKTSPPARDFIKFMLSTKGRAIAAKTGVLVTVGETALP